MKLSASTVSVLFCAASCALAAGVLLRPMPGETTAAEPPGLYAGPVTELISAEAFAGLSDEHQLMISRIAEDDIADPNHLACACFTPDTPNVVVETFLAAIERRNPDRYNQTGRWSSLASGGEGSMGDPVVITYSFAPDGTWIPSGVGEAGAPSDLFATLDAIYGSTAAWQQIYHDMFDRWEELTGITYVHEINDDGADLLGAGGVLGVRGDLRMGGKRIDGNSGTLAYNYFPNNGDMVIDTDDSFYNNTGSDSIRLRNVLSHEHGHGMGQLHVCPIQGNKLMEPFINTGFFGPQHDEIRNAQRMYGDEFEPDNSAGAATDLGAKGVGDTVLLGPIPSPAVNKASLLSIDGTAEQDWFRFTIAEPLIVNASLEPIGLLYDDDRQACGGQPGSCCSGDLTDSRLQADLILEIRASDGTTVVGSANSQPEGGTETLDDLFLSAAGDYYVKISADGSVNETQLYELGLEFVIGPAVVITAPNGTPDGVPTESSITFDVDIAPLKDVLAPGSETIYYRYDGGAFVSAPLAALGGTSFTATLPASTCDQTPEFYLQAEGLITGETVTLPVEGAAAPFAAVAGVAVTVADLDFESAPGWTVDNDPGLSSGAWERGTPVEATAAEPLADFDESGQCYLTDIPDGIGATDVEGGATRLLSPVYDLSGLLEPTLSYARWFSNDLGTVKNATTLDVEVSSDGGANWTPLEIVGPTDSDPNPEVSGDWFAKSFLIEDHVPLTSQFRVRFTVESTVLFSTSEAAIDAFEVRGRTCEDAPIPTCDGDVDGDGDTDVFDFGDLASNFGLSPNATRQQGDLTGDGSVDVFDFADLAADFGCVP